MAYCFVVIPKFAADISGKEFRVVASPIVRALAHQAVGPFRIVHHVGYKGVVVEEVLVVTEMIVEFLILIDSPHISPLVIVAVGIVPPPFIDCMINDDKRDKAA